MGGERGRTRRRAGVRVLVEGRAEGCWDEWTVNLEAHIAEALAAILAPLEPGAAIPYSERFGDLMPALERFLPDLLGGGAEALDGFRFCVARKLGPDRAELIGMALLLSDQAWTPLWLRLRLSEHLCSVAAIDCRLGERRDGSDGLLRVPYGSGKLTKILFALPARVTDIRWAFDARYGELGDARTNQHAPAVAVAPRADGDEGQQAVSPPPSTSAPR